MSMDERKKRAAIQAVSWIKDDMILGLGSGSTMFYVLHALHERIQSGLRIQAMCSSNETMRLANQLQIPILPESTTISLDVNIDGVDWIDEKGNAIKGGGAALTREKILAQWATHTIWVMDDHKAVKTLETHSLPVELLPFGFFHLQQQLEIFGYQTSIRKRQGKLLITDNGNYILDVLVPRSMTMSEAHKQLLQLAGVVETGYFEHIPATAVIASEQETRIRHYNDKTIPFN